MLATATERHALYDNPKRWGSDGIWHQPTFNDRKFQKRLNRIAGTADGKPIVRLVWAWSHLTKDFYYVDWDAFGRGTKAEYRYRYKFLTVPLGNGDTIDIPPPRWILEQRYEPGQYGPSWEAARWKTKTVGTFKQKVGKDENGQDIEKTIDIQRRFEIRPAAPPDGWYGSLNCIAEHDPDGACCERVFRERGSVCWGYYREPAQVDLDMIEQAVRRRNADPYKWSPHQPLPPEALAELERSGFEEAEQAEKPAETLLDAVLHDFTYAHGWRAFANRKQLKHGRYHFVRQSESGLVIPSIK